MRTAVFPGTFDPVTYGHLDVLERGAKLFGSLIVGVSTNHGKSAPLFSADERCEIIRELTKSIPNVTVEQFEGMTVDFCKKVDAVAILRGIRTFSDFEYEFQLALANRAFAKIETVFIMASAENAFVRSTLIKEAVGLGADVSRFVPESVANMLRKRLRGNSGNATGLQGEESHA